MSHRVSTPAVTWLARGERGVSSNAIFQALTGFETEAGRNWGSNYPHDPADLRRCMLLLEQVPEFAPRIDEMAFVSPVWAALAARWKEVTAAFVNEAAPQGGWRGGSWSCPKTYQLMRSIIEGAEAKRA